MKLPFKYIAILVIVSLAGIFAYQAYWLTGLYHTMHSEMERDITEAMRMSDYNEMMIRVDKMKQDDINHGEVSVSAGYSDDGKSLSVAVPPSPVKILWTTLPCTKPSCPKETVFT